MSRRTFQTEVVQGDGSGATALAAQPELSAAWDALGFTKQREEAESIANAKRPVTRERRLAKTLTLLGERR